MTATDLAKRLCGDLVRRVAEWNNRSFIVTNFHYPDGDLVNLYLESDNDIFTGHSVFLTDLGTTLFKARENGVEVTSPRERTIEAICNSYGMEFRAGILKKKLSEENPGADCLTFCEAISRISCL